MLLSWFAICITNLRYSFTLQLRTCHNTQLYRNLLCSILSSININVLLINSQLCMLANMLKGKYFRDPFGIGKCTELQIRRNVELPAVLL